jgi:hypothetical protein
MTKSSSSTNLKSGCPNNHKPRLPPKNVSFHTIEIAEHEYELGDNPSVNGGCPIQIGWQPIQKIALGVEEYEGLRTTPPRNREQMRLPAPVRDHLAKQSGASRAEVEQATQQARKISKSRSRSIKAQPWDKLHYRLEATSRALRKVTSMDGIKILGKSSRPWSSSVDLRAALEDEKDHDDDPTNPDAELQEARKCLQERGETDDEEESEEPLSF